MVHFCEFDMHKKFYILLFNLSECAKRFHLQTYQKYGRAYLEATGQAHEMNKL